MAKNTFIIEIIQLGIVTCFDMFEIYCQRYKQANTKKGIVYL